MSDLAQYTLTPAQWLALKGEVAALGLVIDSDSDEYEVPMGPTVKWNYDGSASLTVSATGFLAGMAMKKIAAGIAKVTA
jgi:hypothetical protein